MQSFKFVSADGQPPPGDDDSLAIRSPEHAAAEAARDDVRVFVIFWDEYHIGRFAEAIKGRKALTDFVTTAFGPADLVALMDPLLPVDALKFTRDRRELSREDRQARGAVRHLHADAQRRRGQHAPVARRRAPAVRGHDLGAAIGGRAPGQHQGRAQGDHLRERGAHRPRPGAACALIRELTETANNNNTAIYTVDPSGLTGGSADVLRTIAENTGAEAFVNTNAPERALRQVVREASAFYLLGYASTRNPQDGKFHKIGVKVQRPGIDVRARKGYWAPDATEIEHARTEAAAAEADPVRRDDRDDGAVAARAERIVDVWVGAATRRGRRSRR